MYYLKIRNKFSAAHNLRHYRGKCEKLHGHNFDVEIEIEGKKLDKTGLLLDFNIIKKLLAGVLSVLDHSYLNEVPPFTKINPTSENIARYIFDEIEKKMSQLNCKASSVSVWESEKASATYEKDE